MDTNIIDFEQELKKDPIEYTILEALTKAAILDIEPSVRETAISALNNRYKGRVHQGFERDGHLFLKAENEICYVCPMPKEYLNQPSNPIPFSLE